MVWNFTIYKLKKGREESLKRFHPWVFSGAIKKIDEKIIEGSFVRVVSSSDEVIGYGYYQIGSIAVRMLTFGDEPISDDLIENRVRSAWDLRKKFGFTENSETNVFRVIFAEGDLLPGLIADYYNGTIVLQFYTVAMFNIRDLIKNCFV